MAFGLAQQLQQEPPIREEAAPWTLPTTQWTPEYVLSTYGADSINNDNEALRNAIGGVTDPVFYADNSPYQQYRESAGPDAVGYDRPAGLLDNYLQSRGSGFGGASTPEDIAYYQSAMDAIKQAYPTQYADYTSPRGGFGGFMANNGWMIPAAIAAGGLGYAALGGAGAGTAAGAGETLTAPTGAAFTELMGSPYMASIPAVEGGLTAGGAGGLVGAAKGAYDTVKPIYDKGKALVNGLLGGGQPTGGAPQGGVNVINKTPQNVPNIAPVNWMTPPPAQTPLARGMSGENDLQQMMQAARKQYWG